MNRPQFYQIKFLTLGIAALAMSYASADQPLASDDISQALDSINKVASGGEGHADAVTAMTILNQSSPEKIPQILDAMTNENKLAVNWLRSAVIKIVGDGSNLPTGKIREYFNDKSNAHLGRLLAFELLTQDNEPLANEIIPGLIDDPSLPLRYMAITNLISKAEATTGSETIGLLGQALNKSRDVEQVIEISKLLGDQGVSIDLQKQLGFINQWSLVGNFNNKDESGFDVVYGPESSFENFDLDAVYDDANEKGATWKSHSTIEPTGLVDLNDAIGKVKGVIAYAHATYDSDTERTVDIRVGCINAHKIWVNGDLVMSNEIYHNGISPDKFVSQAKLKKGKNDILIKVCQNEQTQPWAQRWQFQLRICDETGKAIMPTTPSTVEENE